MRGRGGNKPAYSTDDSASDFTEGGSVLLSLLTLSGPVGRRDFGRLCVRAPLGYALYLF